MPRRSLVEMGFAKTEVNLAVIAKKLGVSASTVSRALRNSPSIHPTTRERVLEVARSLGYQVENRNKSPQANRTVLMLSQAGDASVDGAYLSGLSAASVEQNLTLISHHSRPEDCERLLDPQFQPNVLRSGEAQGVILLHRWPDSVVRYLADRIPVVTVVHTYPGVLLDCIGIQEREGMSLLVAHLVAQGARKIGFFGFCREVSWSRSRFGAYVEALAENGLPFQQDLVVETSLAETLDERQLADLAGASKVFQKMGEGVRHWVGASENLSQSIHGLALARGLSIPRDLALTGFHGASGSRAYGRPILTTTLSSSEELGAAALRRLVTRITNPNESRRTILLPCEFLQGESTLAT
ncbi:MAG: LacI family DNA-binding transcriptional regulator [Candidatus Methylacidiphilales bacterium]|nr:LacI family DNA-binding transcriptional regulator [Candidatus Methylacidiphilales bacterium]